MSSTRRRTSRSTRAAASASDAPKRARVSPQPARATASAATRPARTTRRMWVTSSLRIHGCYYVNRLNLKHLFKRGALLAAANWQVVAVQFIAETTYQALLAVPLVGAAILVTVLLGADLAELLQGSLPDIFTTVTHALLEEPI